MAAADATNACPACGHGEPQTFFRTAPLPIHANVLCNSEDQAIATAKAAIELARCDRCGLIFNAVFDPSLLEYVGDYENPLHFSPRFREYAADLARALVERYDLRGKRIVEIGCGDADFLKSLCDLSGGTGLGYDPSLRAREVAAAGDERVRVVAEPFNAQTAGECDFVYCRHVLEHIARPTEFLTELHATLKERGTPVFFEVPNGLFTFEDEGIWDLIYEHCTYFTPTSLRNVFETAGFEVERTATAYGGQFLHIEARPKADGGAGELRSDPTEEKLVRGFAEAYRSKVDGWQSELSSVAARGETAVVWGAGSKGITFLNVLAVPTERVPVAVDLNPRKKDRFVAGTGQRIVQPDALKDLVPGAVVVMNPIYAGEIKDTLAQLGLTPNVLVA